jgi:hypothetical protein
MIPLTDEEKALIAGIDDCPWCPGHKPGFHTELKGIRDDPERFAVMKCHNCGASRSVMVKGKDHENARRFMQAGYLADQAHARAMLPELVQRWNWKARCP